MLLPPDQDAGAKRRQQDERQRDFPGGEAISRERVQHRQVRRTKHLTEINNIGNGGVADSQRGGRGANDTLLHEHRDHTGGGGECQQGDFLDDQVPGEGFFFNPLSFPPAAGAGGVKRLSGQKSRSSNTNGSVTNIGLDISPNANRNTTSR